MKVIAGTGAAGLGDPSWTVPTLLNSWAQVATFSPVGFRKDGQGFVHLRGRLNGGSLNTNIFILPAGYRPGGGITFFSAAVTDGSDSILGEYFLHIDPATGAVQAQFGSAAGSSRVSMDGFTFLAEN